MIEPFLARFDAFRVEAQSLFAQDEGSVHRVITINAAYQKLSGLSVKQDDMLRQALRCVEVGAYRAAHVMAWAAIIDRLQERMEKDAFQKLNAAMPRWAVHDITDLRERFTEFAIVDAGKAAGFLSKSQCKALHGLLTRRNECAHPSDYYPDLNQALGFVSEVISRIDII